MIEMNHIIKKQITYDLAANSRSAYDCSSYLAGGSVGIGYIIMLFQEIGVNNILTYSQNGNTGASNDCAAFRIFSKNGIKFVGIIDMLEVDLDKDFDDEAFHYVGRLDDFLTIAKKYKQFLEDNAPHFYLIHLSNDRTILEAELTSDNIRPPIKSLEYCKVAFKKDSACYDKVESTSSEFHWFFWLPFHLNSYEKIYDRYESITYREEIPKDLSPDDVKKMLQTWDQLKTKENPVYFVKNEAGGIEVRKSILSLRHVLLARAQDGSYGIKDECGIGVFDFLEEFALGFSPERFLEEYQQSDFSDEIHAIHKNIEITYSKQENIIRLNLVKAPYEFEYIERDRDRYFECRLFEMSLYEFTALMIYWGALKEKAAAEIFFTQRDDGALVIREVQP
jgi:hypothetical protein